MFSFPRKVGRPPQNRMHPVGVSARQSRHVAAVTVTMADIMCAFSLYLRRKICPVVRAAVQGCRSCSDNSS